MGRFKKTSIKLPARASIWYLGASATAKAVGFIITPFFTRMISGQAYGELTLYLTLLGVASVSCSAVNTGSAIYTEIQRNENDKGSFLRSSLVVSVLFSTLFCLLLFTFWRFLPIDAHLIIPLSIQIICDGIVAVAMSSAKFSYRYKEVTFVSIFTSVIPAIITLALLKIVNGRFRVRVYSLLAISICLSIYSVIKIFKSEGKVNKKMCSSLLRTALPLMPQSISTALSGQADKLIITHFLGAIALAKYSVVHSLGVGLQFAVSAIGFALGPWMIRRLEAEDYKRISSLIGLLLSVFSALSLFLIALAPEAMRILAPKEYLDAFPALLPIALTTPLILLSSVITICLVHLGKGKETFSLAIIGALSSLVLNFTLIPKLGYLGAGLSLLLSQLSSTLTGFYLLLRARLGEILSTRKILQTALPTVAIGILLFLLFEIPALRVFLLVAPSIMLLNNISGLKGLILE